MSKESKVNVSLLICVDELGNKLVKAILRDITYPFSMELSYDIPFA